jgi:hypothetical protein
MKLNSLIKLKPCLALPHATTFTPLSSTIACLTLSRTYSNHGLRGHEVIDE